VAFNKEKVMDAARKYVEKNQLDKAVKEYLRIVQEDPKDVRVWLKIGDLYAKKGSKQDATETYLKVARFYQDQGFYLKAVAVYKQILKLDPRLVDVNLKLAELYRQLGLLSDAMQHFEQVAGHFHREGNTKDALATVRQLVDLDPENIATRIKLAELYSKEGLVEEACREFNVASEQLRRQGRQDDFIKVSERLLWHKPENSSLNRELAGLYLRRNDPRRALQKLQVCFKADPRDVETLGLLAQAFQGLDQKAKTVSVLKELARIHVENRHRDKAEEVYTKILQFVPNDPDAVQYLGEKAKKSTGGGMSPRLTTIPPAPTPEPKFNITGELPAIAPGGVRMTGAVPLIDEASLDTDFALPDEEDGGDFSADMASSEGSYRHSSLAGEQHAEEIAKILAETDVYVKYGLHQKAVDHLRRVFALDEENLEARERLKDILVAQGREREALAELIRLAEIAAPVDPERASAHIREALSIDGTNRQAMEIARRYRLDLNTGPVVEVVAPQQPAGPAHGTGAVTPIDDELDFDGLEFEDGPRGGTPAAAAVGVARRDSIDDFDPQELIGGLAHGSPTPAPPPNAPVHAPTTTKREHAALRPIPVDTPDDNLEFELMAPSATRQVDPDSLVALAQMAESEDDLELEAHPVTSDDVPVYRGEGRGQWAQPQPQAARAQHEQAASWQSQAPGAGWGPTQALEDAVAAHLDDDGREIDDEVAAELGAEPIDYDAVDDADVEEMPFDPHEARAFDEGARLRPPSHGGYTGGSTTDEQQGFAAEQPYVYGDGAVPNTHTSLDHYGAAPDDLAVDESSVINATVDDGYRQAGDSQLVRGDQLNAGAGLEDELEEAEFYLSQNMIQEAAEILHGLRSRYGEHPLIVNKLRDIDGMIGGRMPSSAEVGDDAIEGEEQLAVEEASGGTDAISLDEIEELDPDDMQDEMSDPGDLELGAPRGGKKGPSVLLEKPIDDSDADTHYDLGLAYKEMGLWDEAQKAFEKVARAPGREVQCRLMIGLCQREQSNHSGAVHQFKIGLHAASVTERERQTLYYEIGVTYENMGDTSEALYYLEMVTKRDPGFLDAAARVNRLRAGGARPAPEDSDQLDVL
jgi:tetratricopeptide (TPR) repeat protein